LSEGSVDPALRDFRGFKTEIQIRIPPLAGCTPPQVLPLLFNVIPDEQDKGILFLGLPVKTLDKVEISLLYLNGFTSWFLE
jgi:hypothetical protein